MSCSSPYCIHILWAMSLPIPNYIVCRGSEKIVIFVT